MVNAGRYSQRNDPLARYDTDDAGCWIWKGYVCRKSGYGALTFAGVRLYAHRFFYERHVGTVPRGHDVHHTCGVRACVNPAHLELVAHDEHAGGRGHGRLSRADAEEIRRLRREGMTQPAIARRFGVARSHVSGIVNGHIWK